MKNRKWLRVLAAALALALLCAAGAPLGAQAAEADQVPQSLKILSIGNSFSHNTMQYVYTVLKRCGVEDAQVELAWIGGSAIHQHYSNATKYPHDPLYGHEISVEGGYKTEAEYSIEEAVTAKDWDYIMLQELHDCAGWVETFNGEPEGLIDYVKANCSNPDVKVIWMMPWAPNQAYVDGLSPEYDGDELTMYKMISEVVQTKVVPNENIAGIVPNGTAVQNLRTALNEKMLLQDDLHLGDIGKYLVALCFVESLGISTKDVTWYPSGVTENLLPYIRESLNNALANPYEVTPCGKHPVTMEPETTAPAATEPPAAPASSGGHTGLIVGLEIAAAVIAVAAAGFVVLRKKKQ